MHYISHHLFAPSVSGLSTTQAAVPQPLIAVQGRQIFDSRGNPTVEVDVVTADGTFRAAVPSGASTGKTLPCRAPLPHLRQAINQAQHNAGIYEAMERRDGGSAYVGKGVLGAVSAVNDILGPALIGRDVTAQAEIDTYMVRTWFYSIQTSICHV